MHRLATVLLGCLVLSGAGFGQGPGGPASTRPAHDERFVDPPGPLTEAETRLLAEAKERIAASGADPGRVLVDERFAALHPQPAFRELIRAHAVAQPLAIAGTREPGTRLRVTLTLRAADGKPIPGLLVYAYHTSAKGWYAAQAAHVRAPSGDHRHARLFGYVRSDHEGRVVLDTIRPGPYPGTELPEHIHLTAYLGEAAVGSTELLFADDPRVKEPNREGAGRAGLAPATVTREADGSQRAVAEWLLRGVARGGAVGGRGSGATVQDGRAGGEPPQGR